MSSNTYLIPVSEICVDRADESATLLRDFLALKFEGCTVPGSGCGSFGMYLRVENRKIVYTPEPDFDSTSNLDNLMSSAHWLCRLLCTFKLPVESHGTEAYKITWQVAIRHKASGIVFSMYDWKGGISCGLYGDKAGKTGHGTAAFRKDLLALLNYLASDDCVHPYDGVRAGTCA